VGGAGRKGKKTVFLGSYRLFNVEKLEKWERGEVSTKPMVKVTYVRLRRPW
jgi:hypothetical protein